MAKKKEDPAKVAQRKEERVAFVQGHPLLQPEQARQQFYVQTRAQELSAAGKPVDRAQLRENFQTGNIQREGFYTPGDISRVAAQQQNNNTSNNTSNNTPNDSNTPTLTPDAPAGPVYAGGQPTTRTTPSNDYVAPERTTALGGKIPAATQFRMDSAGASGFGKTGESRLVADTPPNQFANRTDASGLSGMGKTQLDPNKTYNVPGPNVLMRGAEDTNSNSYLERRANNDETTLSEYQSQFPAWYKPNAAQLESQKFMTRHSRMTPEEIKVERRQAVANRYGAGVLAAETIAGTAALAAGAPLIGSVVVGAGVNAATNKIFGEIQQSESGATTDEINKNALTQGALSLVFGGVVAGAGAAVGKLGPKVIPALKIAKAWGETPAATQSAKNFAKTLKQTAKSEAKALQASQKSALEAALSGDFGPGMDLAFPSSPAVSKNPFNDEVIKTYAQLDPPKADPLPPVKADFTPETVTESGIVIPASSSKPRTKASIEAAETKPVNGQSLADSKPGANIAADMKADGVTELTPRQVAARAREAKKKEARLALTETTPVASSKPQSALSQEPIGAAASDPNLASPTAPNASGTVTVADAINQGQAKAALKPPSEDTVKYLAEQDRLAALNKLTPAERLETLGAEPSVKNPNRNKALIRPLGDPLPGMERTGNRFDKAKQAFLNKTGFFDTEIPRPQERVVLIHGGPAELKGGAIDPSFTKGNTVGLNDMQLAGANDQLASQQKNIDFLREQLDIPGSYANKNATETLADILQKEERLVNTRNWVDKAQKDNYFTAVDDAMGAYGNSGAYHVISVPKDNMAVGFGPSNEVQVVGRQIPVKSFPISEAGDYQAALKANEFAETLRQELKVVTAKPRSVFEAKTDVDEAFSRITPDELGRAQLENKSLGEIILPKLEAVRAENKALFRDRVRDYENKRYPNIDDMSGRPIPTPANNKPVNISLEDAIKQGQTKAPVTDSVDQGLVEAKRLFEETGVAPKRGLDYQLNKRTGEIYKVKRQSGVPLTPEQKLAKKTANTTKQNNNRKIGRALTSGKIDVETAKEVLSGKPGTVTLADAIKQGTAKEVGTTELGTFVGKDGSLYTSKTTLPDTVKGKYRATGLQTERAKAALKEPIYPRGLPDNAPLFSPPRTITPALEKAYTTELANQARIFETTGKPTAKEDQIRGLIKNLFGPETLGRIDAEAGTGLRTTIKLPSAVTEPTVGAAVKPKFLPSGKIQGETLDEQIANWTKYSNSEGFKTLSLTNPQKYNKIVEANSAINAATKARVDEALAKQSAFKLQMPSKSGKSITKSDDPWQKSLISDAGPMPTEFAGGTLDVRSTDPVLATDRVQNLPYGAEINPPDPNKWVPKKPEPISIDASKEQQIQFNRDIAEYGEELKGTGPESILRARVSMNLENQTALREQAAAMPNSPLKRETIKELNTFNRTNYPNETYPGFGKSGRNATLNADEYLNARTSPWQSSNPQKRIIDPGDTFEKFSKSRAGKGKTEADYAVAKAEYDSKLAALEAEPRGFTGDVEPFVGRFTPEQNQSLEAWSASQQVTETTPRTTISIDELTAGSTNKARVAMEEDAFQRAEAIAEQVKFKAAQEAERTNYFNTRTERGDFDQMREGFARQDANKAAIPKPPTREEVLKTGVIRRLKTRIAEKKAADAAATQAAARADAEEMLPLNVDQYYRERWDQSNPWVVQARQGYQTRINQSGLTNLETRYTSNRPRGLYRGPQPAAPTPEIPVPRSEVSNAVPVSPGVQLRQSAANRDEWLAANEKLKGTPDYIYERSVNEIVPPDMTEAITSIKDEAVANAAEATKEYESFDYGAFD